VVAEPRINEKRIMMPKKTTRAKKQWVYASPRSPKPTVPDEIKAEVQKKADQLVEAFLKPNFIKPLPADTQWNYIVDIYTKWYRSYFYFCSKYHCPSPNAITDYFEAKFVRLEFVGNGKFNVAYLRHTEQWLEIFQDLTLDQCLEAIQDIPTLQP
jgi:hypothetical protein